MAQPQNRLSWGYAATSAGITVIRNWYLLLGSVLAVLFGVALFLGTIGSDRDRGAAIFALVLGGYFTWSCYLEWRGVRIGGDVISYPVRLGLGAGVFPLFRKTISTEQVLQATPSGLRQGIKIAYLSGEFGQAKIVFDTKGGRDRLFAILKVRFPDIEIHRWT